MTTNTATLSALQARRMPDESIFDRTLAGDPIAFAEVYRRYHKRITGYCLARSLDPETAADAAQEVFMRLLAAEPGSITHPRAWLFTVARNAVIDVKRRRARAAEVGDIEEDSLAWDRLRAADTADEVLARADARNVFVALRSMRPRYRTALVMRDIHGQTTKDMAEALDMTAGAVDTLVCRARDAFGAAYAEVGDLPAECRSAIELIYRKTGSGISSREQVALDAHIEGCPRCRAEAKRASDPKRLAALLPFLLPAKQLAHGLLQRATLALRSFPDAVAVRTAPVLTQPHTWNLGAKVAAGLLATALVATPVAATSISHARASATKSAIVSSMQDARRPLTNDMTTRSAASTMASSTGSGMPSVSGMAGSAQPMQRGTTVPSDAMVGAAPTRSDASSGARSGMTDGTTSGSVMGGPRSGGMRSPTGMSGAATR